MRSLRSSRPAALLCLLIVSACAGEDRDLSGPESRGGEHAPSHPPNLFISPFGEPFHAGRDAPYPLAVWFAQADLNHDGRLTREEFRRDAERFFHVLDANHDGVIDGFEIAEYEQKIAPEILPRIEGLHSEEGWTRNLGRGGDRPAQERPDREARGGGGAQLGGLFGLLNDAEPVARADLNLDGRVTLTEFLQAADQRFALLDKAGTGSLRLETLPTPAVARLIATERAKARRAEKH